MRARPPSNRPLAAEGTNTGSFTALDWALFVGAALVFGSSFLFMAIGLEAFDPGLISFLRIGFGFLALSLVPAVRAPVNRKDWGRIALLGLTWLALPLSLFPLAQQRIASSLTGMVNGSTPLFVAAVATVLLHRLPGRRQRLGLAIGVLGLFLVALPSLGKGSSSALGVLLVVAAVSGYGVAFNIAAPLQQRYGILPVLWRAEAVALVLTAPRAVTGLGSSEFGQAGAWAAMAALGIAGTGLAYVATGTLSGRVGSTRASVITYLATPVAMVFGVVFRGDSLASVSVAGAALTLAGAWITSRSER